MKKSRRADMERKRRRGIPCGISVRKAYRALGILLAAAMILQPLPGGVAVSAKESRESGLCEHHTAHTPDCGYREAAPGEDCTHAHTDDCYKTVAGCSHEHDDSCGYREEKPGRPCTFICEICSGGNASETVTPEDGGSDSEAGTPGTETGEEAKEPDKEPEEKPDDGQEECICEKPCKEGSINQDCPVCGAEDADLSECKGKGEEEDTQKPEDTGICKHHQAHDESCGCLPESEDSEGSPCTYVCRICPIEELIAALPDAADITEDNAEEVRARLAEILALYRELTEEEQEQIDLSRCYALQEAIDKANAPMPAAVSADYRAASWDGGEVIYTDKSADCTLVEGSESAVTWNAGWYVVRGAVTISEPITVSGDVRLILADGCDLTAAKGIVVTTGNSLTIYAQSEDGGTLNATGTTDSDNNASAGIGGSTETLDSGSITIHGGVINVAGGYVKNMNGSGAGIGGGGSTDGNGGDSGAITIYNGVITAVGGELDYDKKIATYFSGAGIGGGSSRNNSGGAGSSITIYGGDVTATSKASNNGGAGIGGGAGAYNGGSGNITIRGGTVRATGGCIDMGLGGAGVGGGGSIGEGSGDGTVTIAGGKVTAVGGRYAAGIGGGGGYQYSDSYLGSGSITGGTGSVTISGGIVDASSPTDVDWEGCEGAPIGNGGNASGGSVEKTTGIVFENGVGTVCGNVTFNGSYNVPADYSLHIPAGNSLSGSGTLTGGGTFTTENLTEDMIAVPADLYYNGQDRTEEIAEKVAIDGGITLCGQTFTVSGWTVEVEKTDDLHYTATYTNDGDDTKTFTKTITLRKSGTQFVGNGAVKTYNGETETKDFTADDTITVKAKPTATGAAPTKAAARLRANPVAGEMAVYVGETQVSAPAVKGADGSYTMTVSAAEVLEPGNVEPNGSPIKLTAKFVGNDNMADGAGTVDVNISAVAKVVNGGSNTYVGNLDDAFKRENSGATITLLADVDMGKGINVTSCSVTLDLNGHTVSLTGSTVQTLFYITDGGTLTIEDSKTGGAISNSEGSSAIGNFGGNVCIKSGTVSGHPGVYNNGGSLSITGGTVSGDLGVYAGGGTVDISGAATLLGADTGMLVDSPESVILSGGTFSGGYAAILVYGDSPVTLRDILAEGYAYHRSDVPVTKAEDNSGAVSFDTKPAWLTGTVTVQACGHNGEGVCAYTHEPGATTHSLVCLACGKAESAEPCAFDERGNCPCGAALAVALPAGRKLTYDGTPQTPAVTVKVDGVTTLIENTDYTTAYDNNTDAGTDTATVEVIGKTFRGTVRKTFSIQPATPVLAWSENDTAQTVTYTGKEAVIIPPKASGVGGIGINHHTGPCRYSYAAQGSDRFQDGLPVKIGIYTVRARVEAKGNYAAADSANTLTLTIDRMPNAPDMPPAVMDNVSDSFRKVGSVPLPNLWEWQTSDKNTPLPAGTPVSATAVYVGADRDNYSNVTVTVTITRGSCAHNAGSILYTGDGEKAPTCTADGIGHVECTKCHTVVQEGIAVPAAGHIYDMGEVTTAPTTETEGERTYTCSKCGYTYMEAIQKITSQGLRIDGMEPSVNYTGSAVKQENLKVYYAGTPLREGVDYTVSYKNNTNVGTAQVIVTGKGNYTGKVTQTFAIRPIDISADAGVTVIVATAVETGRKRTPAVTVTWNGKKLREKTDYTLSCPADMKAAGDYDVTISGVRNYTGTMTEKFRVKPRGTKLLSSAKVTGLKKSYPCRNAGLSADMENITVKIGNTTLTKDIDYTVRTENTDAVGKGNIVIEAASTSAYGGEKRIAVTITGTDLRKGSIKGVEKSYPYTGVPVMPQITVYSGRNGSGRVLPADAYTVSYKNNRNKGTATVTATGIPEKGYSGSVKVSCQIGRLDLASEKAAGNIKVTMPADIRHAKGGAKPVPVIAYTYGGTTKTLREGADYTLKYSNNATAAGTKTPTVKITGTGNYSGSIAEEFAISPQDLANLSVTVTDRAYGKNKKGSYYYSAPKVYDLDGKQLSAGRDYTVQYTYADSGKAIGKNDTIAVGARLCATVIPAARSSYTGALRAEYMVCEAKEVKDIAKVKNDKIENQQFTGRALTPEVRLYTQTGKTKTYLTDESYEVVGCYNNIKRGTATILVRGKGAYSGVKRITFKIVQKRI